MYGASVLVHTLYSPLNHLRHHPRYLPLCYPLYHPLYHRRVSTILNTILCTILSIIVGSALSSIPSSVPSSVPYSVSPPCVSSIDHHFYEDSIIEHQCFSVLTDDRELKDFIICITQTSSCQHGCSPNLHILSCPFHQTYFHRHQSYLKARCVCWDNE